MSLNPVLTEIPGPVTVSQQPHCQVTLNSATTFTSPNSVTWNEVVEDPLSMFNGTTTITVPEDGLYFVQLKMYDNGADAGIAIKVNGNTFTNRPDSSNVAAPTTGYLETSILTRYAAGTTLEVEVWNNTVNTIANIRHNYRFSVTKIA